MSTSSVPHISRIECIESWAMPTSTVLEAAGGEEGAEGGVAAYLFSASSRIEEPKIPIYTD